VKILFAGIIARYPFGGVTWCSLMYLLGLRAMGHEVFYIEDTGECVYDPILNTRATDPIYGTTYIQHALAPYGLGDRWAFVNYDGGYHGRSAEDVRRWAADGTIKTTRSDGGQRLIAAAELRRLVGARRKTAPQRTIVAQSARNRFPGVVTRVEVDRVAALVEVQAGPHRLVSLLTAEAVRELGLEPGVQVIAVVKATNVMIDLPS